MPRLLASAPWLPTDDRRTGAPLADGRIRHRLLGAGFDVADRMGLLPAIMSRGYRVKELQQIDRSGKRISGLAVNVFDRLTGGRFTSLPRSELAASIYGALNQGVETIFDDSITTIADLGHEVRVGFERSRALVFDLVVGADGLHSQVRRLVLGEQDRFEQYLGLKVAAFAASGYRPRDELVYVIHTELERQVGRFSMRDDRSMFLFVFADPDPEIPSDPAEQKALLRETFSGSDWECPHILEALDKSHDLYFDRVSQIRMHRWARGRVALVGDAAFCVSLLGGQGSALAMVAAYILAGELKRANGDHQIAFAQYEQRLGAFIASKQKAAVRFSSFFAPRSRFQIFLRNQVMKLMVIPFITRLAVGRALSDRIELPTY